MCVVMKWTKEMAPSGNVSRHGFPIPALLRLIARALVTAQYAVDCDVGMWEE